MWEWGRTTWEEKRRLPSQKVPQTSIDPALRAPKEVSLTWKFLNSNPTRARCHNLSPNNNTSTQWTSHKWCTSNLNSKCLITSTSMPRHLSHNLSLLPISTLNNSNRIITNGTVLRVNKCLKVKTFMCLYKEVSMIRSIIRDPLSPLWFISNITTSTLFNINSVSFFS